MPRTTRPRTSNLESVGKRLGFRSGLEERIARELESQGVPVKYEAETISYTKPSRPSRYTPDFILPNGIIIETKGRFVAADRQKHLLVQAQHPDLDIRFVFSNSRTKLYKGSPTTYAKWCEKHGFKYADKSIPQEWIREDC
jgi:hypothetical protein